MKPDHNIGTSTWCSGSVLQSKQANTDDYRLEPKASFHTCKETYAKKSAVSPLILHHCRTKEKLNLKINFDRHNTQNLLCHYAKFWHKDLRNTPHSYLCQLRFFGSNPAMTAYVKYLLHRL